MIVEHEIITYEGSKPVKKSLSLVNVRKATTIEGEIEMLLKAEILYPIPLTRWASHIVPITKK